MASVVQNSPAEIDTKLKELIGEQLQVRIFAGTCERCGHLFPKVV